MDGTRDLTQQEVSNLQSRRLKRKSEEGVKCNKVFDIPLAENERPSPKLRKYSFTLQAETDKQEDAEAKESECQFTADVPLHYICTTKDLNGSYVKKRPLVPRLENVNVDREQSPSKAGVILSLRAEKPFKCGFCCKQFKYSCNLKSHTKIVHKKNAENHSKICMDSSVNSAQVFQCEVCFRNFKYISNLRTHRLVHTSNENERVQAPY